MGDIDESFRDPALDDIIVSDSRAGDGRAPNRPPSDDERVAAFLDGRLEPEVREAMLAHLARTEEESRVAVPRHARLLRNDDDREVAAPARPRRLVRPPGSRLLSAAEWLLSRKNAGRIVGQAVADMRKEYFEALADGRRHKARYIVARDTARILLAAGQAAWHRVGKFLLGFFKVVG